jgi:hypothetical protein
MGKVFREYALTGERIRIQPHQARSFFRRANDHARHAAHCNRQGQNEPFAAVSAKNTSFTEPSARKPVALTKLK